MSRKDIEESSERLARIRENARRRKEKIKRLLKENLIKKEKTTKPVKQAKMDRNEERKKRLKKFEGWDAQKVKTTKDLFEKLVREGKNDATIMNALGFKHKRDFKYWIEEQYAEPEKYRELKDIERSIVSRMGTPTEEWGRLLGRTMVCPSCGFITEKKLVEEINPKTHRKRQVQYCTKCGKRMRYGTGSFAERCFLKLCPIISTGQRSVTSRKYPPVKEGEVFCDEINVIPDISLQPIKRLRIAAHSFTASCNEKDPSPWKDGEFLKDLSASLCEDETDKFTTFESGIIISRSLHEQEGLDKGDKLLGLNGLKGVVCEVRDMETDLLINKNQIWDKKASRQCGGAVLELKENKGKLSCFYQKAHTIQETVYTDEEGEIYGRGKFSDVSRFSPDLVPFLMHYLGFETLKDLTRDNRSKVKDYLKFLNARFTTEPLMSRNEFDAWKEQKSDIAAQLESEKPSKKLRNEMLKLQDKLEKTIKLGRTYQIVFEPFSTQPSPYPGGEYINFDKWFYCR